MWTWTCREAVATPATPAQIWAVWQQVAHWPTWDSELKWSKLQGEFSVGARGKMQPNQGPVVDFVLSDVQPEHRFVTLNRLPLTEMVFDHVIEVQNGQRYLVHSVTMTGWLAPLFGRLIGTQIQKHLPAALLKLSQQAMQQEIRQPA
jgi:hypothetical protein